MGALTAGMNILIVYAHPDPRSLTGALKDVAVQQLRSDGHDVAVSDLHAMNWKPQADADDFGELAERSDPAERTFAHATGDAYRAATLTDDIRAEHDKLLWADAVLLHFPLWWYSMPAILKGWVDRVFTNGFAYGAEGGTALPRYGAGILKGKRAMLVVSVGGREPAYSERGINGHIDDVLYPINHGILYYPGMDVLPPFPAFGANRVNDERVADISEALRHRLSEIDTVEPIAYRPQDGGDYDRSLRLKPGLERPETTGFALHVAS